MVVSHDSAFLDHVCTDIFHYESRKLKRYKGNISEFVKVRPGIVETEIPINLRKVRCKYQPVTLRSLPFALLCLWCHLASSPVSDVFGCGCGHVCMCV
jgi:hypothetical protein